MFDFSNVGCKGMFGYLNMGLSDRAAQLSAKP